MKRTLFLALLFFCCGGATAVYFFVTRAAAAPQQQQRSPTRARKVSPQTAQAKPVAVRETDLAGLKKLLAREQINTQAARPLLVNFWATWCEPCREEFPDLVQINKDYKARGLEFVTVSLDESGEIKTGVPQFLRQMRSTMPAYLLNVPDPEPAIKWVDAEWGGGLPATYLYNAQGQIVFKHMGRIKPAELRSAINTVTSDK
ncbi:MAG: redoxin domain-containing protein [Pyrinomonadaceae bacterium]